MIFFQEIIFIHSLYLSPEKLNCTLLLVFVMAEKCWVMIDHEQGVIVRLYDRCTSYVSWIDKLIFYFREQVLGIDINSL